MSNSNKRENPHGLYNVSIDNVPAGTASEIMGSLSDLYNPKRKSLYEMQNDEIIPEFLKFVQMCQERDMRIGIELLCLYFKTTKQTLWNYEHGKYCDTERQQIVQQIKAFLRAYIEQLTLTNKVSAPVGIFWSKNYLQMSDTQTIDIVQDNSKRTYSIDELPKLALSSEKETPPALSGISELLKKGTPAEETTQNAEYDFLNDGDAGEEDFV